MNRFAMVFEGTFRREALTYHETRGRAMHRPSPGSAGPLKTPTVRAPGNRLTYAIEIETDGLKEEAS